MFFQLIFSIIFICIALMLVIYSAYNLVRYKLKKKSLKPGVALFLLISSMGGGMLSTYLLVDSAYALAKKGAKKAYHISHDIVSETVSFATVSISEGFGKSFDYFKEKWKEEMLLEVSSLNFTISAIDKSKDNNISLYMNIHNQSDKEIDLNKLIEEQIILGSDEKGVHYPLKGVSFEVSKLPPRKISQRRLTLELPNQLKLHYLVTPAQKVLLKKN